MKILHEPIRGFLNNPLRKARREQPFTLTDRQVLALIEKIDSFKKYSKLETEVDRELRLRDKAVICIGWIFFKRGTEILHIRLGEATYDSSDLIVSFMIQKKAKKQKMCPTCDKANGTRNQFCNKCGTSLRSIEPIDKKKPYSERSVKRKDLDYPFCKHVTEWIDHLREKGVREEGWIFPRYAFFSRGFQFYAEKPLTYNRLDQILQKLDLSLTSHMFRYGATERLYQKGYDTKTIMDIGDWDSPAMPLLYAKRKGITPGQIKFSKDIEII
ncbi:MAG: tyrosine-type recombinase/integrase [Nanoarchaeota archaeon]|nr:tyrosine-type recombinase/integrase [Nanoarchaeota archaeon]